MVVVCYVGRFVGSGGGWWCRWLIRCIIVSRRIVMLSGWCRLISVGCYCSEVIIVILMNSMVRIIVVIS